jgi:hypothetical protein
MNIPRHKLLRGSLESTNPFILKLFLKAKCFADIDCMAWLHQCFMERKLSNGQSGLPFTSMAFKKLINPFE